VTWLSTVSFILFKVHRRTVRTRMRQKITILEVFQEPWKENLKV